MSVSTPTIGWTRIGLIVACLTMAACMAKPTYLPVQEIPEDQPISYAEEKLSNRIYTNFNKRFQLSDDTERQEQLTRLVDHLSRSVGEHPGTWRVHLLEAPDISDVRAVVGNRIFVWSGLYDVIANEDELGGLLAHEMAHDLARHTMPVRFNLASSLLFQTGSMVSSIALMIASQGAVNLGTVDWMRLAYVEARDLGPEERNYSPSEEMRAAAIALEILARSECRPEALIEFYWRSLETSPHAQSYDRLHRNLAPGDRIDILEELASHPLEWQRGTDADHAKWVQHQLKLYPAPR